MPTYKSYSQTQQIKLVRERTIKPYKVQGPKSIFHFFRPLRDEPRESMHVVCLDVRHNVLGTDTVSIGTATSSIFHPRELFRLAILLNASAIALVHNHPSGSVVPSAEDSQVTTRLKDCCDLMGIHLIDHVIVGVGGFYSFRENGGLQW